MQKQTELSLLAPLTEFHDLPTVKTSNEFIKTLLLKQQI